MIQHGLLICFPSLQHSASSNIHTNTQPPSAYTPPPPRSKIRNQYPPFSGEGIGLCISADDLQPTCSRPWAGGYEWEHRKYNAKNANKCKNCGKMQTTFWAWLAIQNAIVLCGNECRHKLTHFWSPPCLENLVLIREKRRRKWKYTEKYCMYFWVKLITENLNEIENDSKKVENFINICGKKNFKYLLN